MHHTRHPWSRKVINDVIKTILNKYKQWGIQYILCKREAQTAYENKPALIRTEISMYTKNGKLVKLLYKQNFLCY